MLTRIVFIQPEQGLNITEVRQFRKAMRLASNRRLRIYISGQQRSRIFVATTVGAADLPEYL